MANPLAVVESGTARVSVLPDVGSELPTVYVGNGALDVVGLRVGQSCLRMNLQDERGYCESDVSARQPLCQGSDGGRSCQHRIP